MLKCEIGKNIVCTVQVEGNVLEISNDTLNLLSTIYKDFKENCSPEEAEIYRLLMLRAVQDKDWDTWTVSEAEL